MSRSVLAATVLIPVHPAGWPFVGTLAVVAVALLFAGWGWSLPVALAALATAFFFRDPERQTPVRQGLVVSPADGRVVDVAPAVPPEELALPASPRMRVSIFLSIFDVHINRAPVGGVVSRRIHVPGRFGNAAFAAASEANERQSWLIEGDDGPPVAVVQIAGLIARRILGWVAEGGRVETGERIGMIRFGSRVDVYLPEGMVPLVAVGQMMIGGETVIADARANEPPPTGGGAMNVSRERLRGLHINRMIPNTLTLLALACGLTALRFALQERWEPAVLAIVVAGVLDGLDGRIARILKGTTKFGAELDSLSDFLCFGVAPALTLYLWSLNSAGRVGWWLVLLLCICCALRLARFNTISDDLDAPPLQRSFFVGMPSPAGAGLALLPMVLWFQLEADLLRHPVFVGLCVAATSALLVCRLRTFTFKRVRIAQGWVLPAMLIVGLYLACLASNPWLTLALTEIAYLASIPISVRLYRRRLGEEATAGAAEETALAPPPPPAA